MLLSSILSQTVRARPASIFEKILIFAPLRLAKNGFCSAPPARVTKHAGGGNIGKILIF